MGVATRWLQARTAMVVAECGTGKTLISLGAIHVHHQKSPFTACLKVIQIGAAKFCAMALAHSERTLIPL